MSNPLAHYAFLPWLRRGIGTMIPESDALGASPGGGMAVERANVLVGITIDSTSLDGTTSNSDTVNKTFQFQGPPDVLGISEKGIVRTEPKPGVNNYESNGLPYIEFFEEDFLWVYTPASAGTAPSDVGKLTPWLALICLKDDEFEMLKGGAGRSFIRIQSTAMDSVFHAETQHWAWGHVQMNTDLVAGTLSGQISEVSGEIEQDPNSGSSRLLCPRKLQDNTRYTACLVPAFETGRRAGLGVDFAGVFAQEMSWKNGLDYSTKPRGTDYPCYHSWVFQTDDKGDFESLARLIESFVAPPELGRRRMFINDAGMGLEGMADSVELGVEGALMPPSYTPAAWPNGSGDTAYKDQLEDLLNLGLDAENQTAPPAGFHPFAWGGLGDDPVVTPHIYGRWHALVNRLQAGQNPAWVDDLNLDPRNRAAAGLGVEVVQTHQEEYMKEAWQQVEAINEANEKIRKAVLASMVNRAIQKKHISRASTDQKLRMISPSQKFIKFNGKTIKNQIHNSLIPNASQEAGFKKITRPGKKGNRKLNKQVTGANVALHVSVTEKFDGNAIFAAPTKANHFTAITQGSVDSAITAAITTYNSNNVALATEAVFAVIQEEEANPALYNQMHLTARKNVLKGKINGNPGLTAGVKTKAVDLIDGIKAATHGSGNSNSLVEFNTPEFQAHFGTDYTAKIYQQTVLFIDTNGAPGSSETITTSADILAYQYDFNTFGTFASLGATSLNENSALGGATINSIGNQLEVSLNQKGQMLSRLASAITLKIKHPVTGVVNPVSLPSLKPIMAHPEYDQPMFRDLKAISKDYILPNLNQVPANSISLMKPNQRFIEAYMAGLNFEMGRELLWREYPTDQRGSYFRRFWDIADDIFTTNPELKLDIKKVHEWTGALGSNANRVADNVSGDFLVLLIRGDLLRKYPNTQVYAQKAAFANPAIAQTPRVLSDESVDANFRFPLFMAELEPDVYLFGFDLDEAEAKGNKNDVNQPGWYFCLRERPGQIRFGLDDHIGAGMPVGVPTNWNDLTWEHMVNSNLDLEDYQLDADFNFALSAGSDNSPVAKWGKTAADMAYILYQNPVLYARHANEMLP